MKIVLIFASFLLAVSATGCSRTDPSKYDVKSPCVGFGYHGKDPCVRRKLVENDVA